MAKITMPEPVALASESISIDSNDLELFWASKPIPPLAERTGVRPGSLLITTDQAEAYKDACVREAMEEAIQAVEACNTSGTIRSGTVDQCVEAIRALIPK